MAAAITDHEGTGGRRSDSKRDHCGPLTSGHPVRSGDCSRYRAGPLRGQGPRPLAVVFGLDAGSTRLADGTERPGGEANAQPILVWRDARHAHGVSTANLFLLYVERHRQRSERLEIRGAWVEPGRDPLLVGVGFSALDVRLEGDPYRLDRWSVSLVEDSAGSFRVTDAQNVEMLEARGGRGWRPGGSARSVIGRALSVQESIPLGTPDDPDAVLELIPKEGRGLLAWGSAQASLSAEDPLLDRRLGRRLRAGSSWPNWIGQAPWIARSPKTWSSRRLGRPGPWDGSD